MNCQHYRVVVLGGGITGLSAAWHLRHDDCLLLERSARVGGLANTDEWDGFLFDAGSHIWFTQDQYAQSWVDALMGSNLQTHQRSAWVHIYGSLIPAPFQANLHGLPLNVVSECLIGFYEARLRPSQPSNSFSQWLMACFGDGIYRHFHEPYNSKVWTVHPDELATDWTGARVDVPDVRQMINGAIGLEANALGPNARFSYPVHGGIEAIIKAMAMACQHIRCNADIGEIDLARKTLRLNDGGVVSYEKLISTIPLPSLAGVVKDLPSRQAQAASLLHCTQLVIVNIALKRKPEHDYHWIYFPEPDYPFFRVSFPHNYSTYMCPSGCGSIQAECAFPASTAVDPTQVAVAVQRALREAGYLDESQVAFVRTRTAQPAYILCDHSRMSSRQSLLPFFAASDVICCGRFGAWDYLNMDQCVVEGKSAAEQVCSDKELPSGLLLAN